MEILACPHCARLFRVTPAVLGKKIRCRGCREIFHVPSDTTSVPLGPPREVGPAGTGAEPPPLAIAGMRDGREVRSCPGCGRTFAMKPTLVDKTIRCRGCKAPFRVATSAGNSAGVDEARPVRLPADRSLDDLGAPASRQSSAHSPARTQPSPSQRPIQPPRRREPSAAAVPRPTIFEDIGDVLEDLRPGERVASVVRPRNAAALAKPEHEAAATLIAVVLGAACAPPIVQLILWWVFDVDPLHVGASLPAILEWIAPLRWRN